MGFGLALTTPDIDVYDDADGFEERKDVINSVSEVVLLDVLSASNNPVDYYETSRE